MQLQTTVLVHLCIVVCMLLVEVRGEVAFFWESRVFVNLTLHLCVLLVLLDISLETISDAKV